MPVGTSSGQYYDDDFEYHHAQIFGNSDVPVTKNPPQTEVQEGLTKPKTVHIVRHGETTENVNDTVRGWEPVSLNEHGRKEAEENADELKAKGVDTIVSSDLQRAKETALIIGAKLGIAPTFDPRLRTWNVGEHAGKPCETSNPILKDYVKNKPDVPVPGGESFNEFTNRSFAGIRDAILDNKDKNLAIVTHNRVEGTLKGWEKTGQDNPDIDLNEATKETTPGNVRSIKFQPDATILNTFDDRFVGEPKNLPTDVPGYDPDKMPLNWWRTERPLRDITERQDIKRQYQGRANTIPFNPNVNRDDLNLYNPIMEDTTMNKIIKEGGTRSGGSGSGGPSRDALGRFLKGGEGYPGPRDMNDKSLENIQPREREWSPEDLKALVDKGMSHKEIARELDLSPDNVRARLSRSGISIRNSSKERLDKRIQEVLDDLTK